jgi:hypothetical protein
MLPSRLVCASLLALALSFTISNSASALSPKVNAVTKKSGHLDNLHMAAHELKHAHAAVNGNGNGKGKKGGNPVQHVSAAIGHIEQAIQLHKANNLNQNRPGLAGSALTAAHHHHHSQLQEALHAAKEAEKHLAAGNAALASKEIEKAHHHVELAIEHHRALTGK